MTSTSKTTRVMSPEGVDFMVASSRPRERFEMMVGSQPAATRMVSVFSVRRSSEWIQRGGGTSHVPARRASQSTDIPQRWRTSTGGAGRRALAGGGRNADCAGCRCFYRDASPVSHVPGMVAPAPMLLICGYADQ